MTDELDNWSLQTKVNHEKIFFLNVTLFEDMPIYTGILKIEEKKESLVGNNNEGEYIE